MAQSNINTDDCWLYARHINSTGYGFVCIGKNKKLLAHRLMYEASKGEIPQGLVMDHLCRVRCCVNPAHLEAVTDRVNLMRGEGAAAKGARQTHCRQGHAFRGYNLYRLPRTGYRRCRTCMQAWNRRFYAKKHAAL